MHLCPPTAAAFGRTWRLTPASLCQEHSGFLEGGGVPALGGARTLRRYLYPARLPIDPPRGSYGSIVASSDGDTKSCSVFRKVEAKNRRDQHRDRDHERRPEHEQEEVDHALCSSFVAAKSCERGPKRSMISGKAYPHSEP